MENLIKKIATTKNKGIFIYNLGKRNEKFEFVKKLRKNLGTVAVYTNDDFTEHLITSLYEKNDPVETFSVNTDIVVFYDIDFLTNKPSHIKTLKELTARLHENSIMVIYTCHSDVPEDVYVQLCHDGFERINGGE